MFCYERQVPLEEKDYLEGKGEAKIADDYVFWGVFGFEPKLALPKYWCAHEFFLLFGWTPNIWLAQPSRRLPMQFSPVRGRAVG